MTSPMLEARAADRSPVEGEPCAACGFPLLSRDFKTDRLGRIVPDCGRCARNRWRKTLGLPPLVVQRAPLTPKPPAAALVPPRKVGKRLAAFEARMAVILATIDRTGRASLTELAEATGRAKSNTADDCYRLMAEGVIERYTEKVGKAVHYVYRRVGETPLAAPPVPDVQLAPSQRRIADAFTDTFERAADVAPRIGRITARSLAQVAHRLVRLGILEVGRTTMYAENSGAQVNVYRRRVA